MEYSIRYDLKASELFAHTMRTHYRTMAGMVNIVFTAAMWVLAFRFLTEWNPFLQAVLIIACIWFPLIHPLALYGKSVRDLEPIPKDMVINFRYYDVQVLGGGKAETLHYDKLRAVRDKNLLIIMCGGATGYMITDRMLQDKKEEFMKFFEERLGKTIGTVK